MVYSHFQRCDRQYDDLLRICSKAVCKPVDRRDCRFTGADKVINQDYQFICFEIFDL